MHYIIGFMNDFLDIIIAADARRSTNVSLMLAHRLRRWANIKPTVVHRLVSGGYSATFLPSNLEALHR